MSDKMPTPEERELAESLGMTNQPPPVLNENPSSHDRITLALAQLINGNTQRKNFGMEKYGTPLQAGNGRDAVQDALDEGFDLMVYLQVMKDELPMIYSIIWEEGHGAGSRDALNDQYTPNPFLSEIHPSFQPTDELRQRVYDVTRQEPSER